MAIVQQTILVNMDGSIYRVHLNLKLFVSHVHLSWHRVKETIGRQAVKLLFACGDQPLASRGVKTHMPSRFAMACMAYAYCSGVAPGFASIQARFAAS